MQDPPASHRALHTCDIGECGAERDLGRNVPLSFIVCSSDCFPHPCHPGIEVRETRSESKEN